MKKEEVQIEIAFVNSQLNIFKERREGLERRGCCSNDFDRCAFWTQYNRVISELERLLRLRYNSKR